MLNKKVKDVMISEVITINPSEDVVKAFEQLMENRISAMPVIDDGEMVGIITATDLGHNLILDKYELGTPVKSVMMTKVFSVSPDETLADAIKIMKNSIPEEGIINQLPVLKDNKLIGIISDGDIIKAISD